MMNEEINGEMMQERAWQQQLKEYASKSKKENKDKRKHLIDAILGMIIREGAYFFFIFVVWKLYGWFVVPILGFPVLTYGYVFVLYFFLKVLTHNVRSTAILEKIYSEQVKSFHHVKLGFIGLAGYSLFLLIGYILKLIVM